MEESEVAPFVAPHRSRGDDRRRQILQALHDCVMEQGYAKTTLADVARAAGMSPSHLLYYYDGTDAILADFFAKVGRRLIERLKGFREEPPDVRIQRLADMFFASNAVKKSEVGFMLECFGIAVHDRRLSVEKTAFAHYCKDYLRQLFIESPCGSQNAQTSSELAYAMLFGLRTGAYFDPGLGPARARQLFLDAMLELAKLRRAE